MYVIIGVIRQNLGYNRHMKRFERMIKELTIEKFLALEDELLECDQCYCREECLADKGEKSCRQVRKEWLSKEEE